MVLFANFVLLNPHLQAVVPMLRLVCAAIFIVGGIAEFRRPDGAFQPLDYTDADKLARTLTAVVEIVCGILMFINPCASIAAGMLFALCVGAMLMDPPIVRRSPMLPVLCILLFLVFQGYRKDLDYWRTHSFDPDSVLQMISR